jgi:hypothetical protein
MLVSPGCQCQVQLPAMSQDTVMLAGVPSGVGNDRGQSPPRNVNLAVQ